MMAWAPSPDSRKVTSSLLSWKRFSVRTAGSCSVDVKGDEEYLVFAQFLTECVDTAAALREGDILQLRNQESGIEAQGDQVFLNLFCEEASVCVFAEEAVRAPLARGVLAMAIVKEDCHSKSQVCLPGCKMARKSGNITSVKNLSKMAQSWS